MYPTPRKLTADEIDAVVAYLRARVIGRGPDHAGGVPGLLRRGAGSWCDSFK